MKKTRRKTSPRKTPVVDSYHQAMECWKNIVTLAQLLHHCGGHQLVEASTVAHTGDMLLEESHKLCERLHQLRPK